MRLLTTLLLLVSATGFAAEGSQTLAKCSFKRSFSISFGYSWIYTLTGSVKDAGFNGNHLYEVDGPVDVSIDQTASTNFPGKHVADYTAKVNNMPWGNNLLLDISSPDFRILVFKTEIRNGVYSAFEMDGTDSNGFAGSCTDIPANLLNQ